MADSRPAPDDLALRVARLLRHEVGDLLQGVYTTSSVLLSRFGPAQALEHRLVTDLQQRAELLRAEIDAAVLLLQDEPPRLGTVDVAGIAQAALASQRRVTPDLAIKYDGPTTCHAQCDAGLLPEALPLLVAALAQGARALSVRIVAGPVVECWLERQGHVPAPAVLDWPDAPFSTTQQGLLGLALAMATRATTRAGGAARATRLPQGVAVRLGLPVALENVS